MRKNNLLPLLIFILTFFLLTLLQGFVLKTITITDDLTPFSVKLLTEILSFFIICIPYLIVKISLFIANKFPDSLYVKLFFENWFAPAILLIICIFLDLTYTLPNVSIFALSGISFFTGNFVTLLWVKTEYKIQDKTKKYNKNIVLKIMYEIFKLIVIPIVVWVGAMFLLFLSYLVIVVFKFPIYKFLLIN